MSIGKLIVELVASTATFQGDLGKAAAVAEQQARRIDKAIANTKKQAIAFGKEVAAALGVTASAAGLIALFDEIKQKTEDSERSVAQLNAVLIATGGSAGLTAAALEKLGKGVEQTTIFSPEEIRAAETALLRFRTVQKGVFEDALKLVPDLAAALGRDLPTAAEALGKALTEPQTGLKLLKAAGFSLSEQQKDLAAHLIEVGDRAGAQRIVLDELTASVGGASEADTKGLYGASKRLSRAFGELEIAAGHKLFGDNHTIIEEITSKFDLLTRKVDTADFSLGKLAKTFLSLFAGPATSGRIALDIFDTSTAQRTSKGKISGLPDPEEEKAAAAAAVQRAKEAANQAYLIQQAAIKKLAESGTAAYVLDIGFQKRYLDEKNADLQFAYSRGLVTVDNFYDEQKRLAQKQIADEQAIQAKVIANQIRLIEAPSSAGHPDIVEAARARYTAAGAAADKAMFDGELKIKKIEQDRVVAIEALTHAYAQLDAEILDLQGHTAEAAKIRLAVQDAADRMRFQTDPAALAQLNEKERLLGLTYDLTAAQTKFGQVLQGISIIDSTIDLKLQTGNITEIDALSEKTALHQKFIPILEAEAAAYETLAKQTTNPAYALAAAQLRLEIAQLAAQSDVLASKFRDIFKGGLSDALTSFATGAKSAKDILKDLVKSVDEGISRIAANNISEAVLGKGGPLGGLSDFFAGLFGGKGADATGAVALTGSATVLAASGGVLTTAGAALIAAAGALSASAGASSFGGLFGSAPAGPGSILGLLGDIPMMDTGSPFVPRDMLAVVHRGEAVIPAAQNRGGRAGGDTHIYITQHVAAGASRASAEQAASATAREIQRARRVA